MEIELFKVYDNAGRTYDRFTVLYLFDKKGQDFYYGRAMSDNPKSESGVNQIICRKPHKYLGTEIKISDLPRDCQDIVMKEVRQYNHVNGEKTQWQEAINAIK